MEQPFIYLLAPLFLAVAIAVNEKAKKFERAKRSYLGERGELEEKLERLRKR